MNSGLDLQDPLLAIEVDHACQVTRVKEDPAGAELLAAHRVTAARDGNRLTRVTCVDHGVLDLLERTDRDDGVNDRFVQLGVNVVDRQACHRRMTAYVQRGLHYAAERP
ncbi:MAG: hypothetical protein M3R70_09940 [Actinomycetota bacterium]|nr:hypothetical protein [Actinomycetota bacterium]